MNRPEIPGFYFDVERNRYFKITNASNNSSRTTAASAAEHRYSKDAINTAKQIDETVKADAKNTRYITDAQLISEKFSQWRYRDNLNNRLKSDELEKLRTQLEMSNMRPRAEIKSMPMPFERMIYDSKDDNLISTTHNRIFVSSCDAIRKQSELDLHEYEFQMNPNRFAIVNTKLIQSDSGRRILLTLRQLADSREYLITLSKLGLPTPLSTADEVHYPRVFGGGLIQEYQNISMRDYNTAGEVALTNDCIALTTMQGIDVMDFRRLKRKLRFNTSSYSDSDLLRVDFQTEPYGNSNILGMGSRGGEVFLVDTRVDSKLRKPNTVIEGKPPVCGFQFFRHDRNKFLISGLQNYLAAFDMRNLTGGPLIQYKNFNNTYNLQTCVEIREDGFILAKDNVLQNIKIYDVYNSEPLSQLGKEGSVGQFTKFRDNELCVLHPDGKAVDYWSV